ncbi:ABC transporter permease [Alkalihalobacillus oceani]|uniref:ABC transporter permease n=1 Tax=Halalkalibacter oceani TaxID=1653776 RepID=A0A9X2ILJ8_9BACI|nr:ABC transporter permease [Halalkalibacter oceani]MCM3712939.1 ABC transporter permease [Halalkalibacter oceani]
MSVKALFRKEWKQSWVLLTMITLLFVFLYPMRTFLGLNDWRERINDEYFFPQHEVPAIFGVSMTGIMILIFLVLLAVQFLGTERNTRRHDFAFALPFKRRTMFFVKWLLGVGTVTVAMLVTFTIAYAVIMGSEFAGYLEGYQFWRMFLTPWLGYVAMYSFTLFIGTITGEMVSQIVLTFIFTIFPIGFIALLANFISTHTGVFPEKLDIFFFQQFVWPIYNFAGLASVDDGMNLWIPAVAIVLFLGIGAWIYERNPSEYNGEFLLFKHLETLFRIGIVTCFSLLGGMIVSGLVPFTLSVGTKIIFYWLGFFLFLVLSFFFTKRLFRMNITVKGK